MKKRLEAELISIAHRVLKLKNKAEIDQLFAETQKLYEALSVLKFYGDHIEKQPAPEIGREVLEDKIAASLDAEPAAPLTPEAKAEIAEATAQVVPVAEEAEPAQEAEAEKIVVGEITLEEEEEEEAETQPAEAVGQTDSDPLFEMAAGNTEQEEEEEEDQTPAAPQKEKESAHQISFEDLLGSFKDVEFVKPNDITPAAPVKEQEKEIPVQEPPKTQEIQPEIPRDEPKKAAAQEPEKVAILNEKLATGINIGLNDRVGFVKYLFDNSSEDFNRVLSQLNTFDTYAEAEAFIDDMVKPDYNNWKGQEDFSERFMDIVKQKFQ